MRTVRVVSLLSVVVVVVGGGLVPAAAEARSPKPVITSVEPAVGSSVGYAHVLIHGRHLSGATVTVAGRKAYAKVINSRVISAFPAGHHHGKRYTIVVRTKAGRSNAGRYEFRYAAQPRLRAAAAGSAPGGSTAHLGYSVVRCPATGTCVSLGRDGVGPVARVTTRGRTVTQRVPVPADYSHNGTAELVGLSCPTTTFCAATGSYNADSVGLFSTWNGSVWSSRKMPAPVGDGYPSRAAAQVSCGAPGRCVAIDEENAYTLDGTSLAVAPSFLPAGATYVRVDQVSCPAAGWCAVTGSAGNAKAEHNYLAIRNGTRWTKRTLSEPRAGTHRTSLDPGGLDCAAVDRCTLIAGGGNDDPLYFAALRAGTTRWTRVPVPADARKHDSWAVDFGSIPLTCPTTTTCWSPAAYQSHGLSGRRNLLPVAVRLHDRSATVTVLPRPASSRTGFFTIDDLSCATASSCVAVGGRGDGDANDVRGDAIVETFAGGVWTPTAAPSPAGRPKYSDYAFSAVDCSGVARCTAVGEYDYDHNPDAGEDEPLQQSRPVVLEVSPR